MKLLSIIAIASIFLVSGGAAFHFAADAKGPSNRFAMSTRNGGVLSRKISDMPIKMALVEDLPGVLPPVGFFDPLGISQGNDENAIKKFREAELKHGRIAMLASVGILLAERFNPLFDGKILGAGIYHFQQADQLLPYFWVIVLFAIALIEGQTILTAWDSVEDSQNKPIADLRADYEPGDLGFDPLGLAPSDPAALAEMRTKELQNGRLAMLGIAGIVAQELLTGQPIPLPF